MEFQTPPEVSRRISLVFRRGFLSQNGAGSSAGIPSPPAITSPKSAATSRKSPSSKSLPKKVLLEDWWLVKSAGSVNGKQIGVGGTARAGTRACREFSSAAIVKRCDAWNVETADGILVKLMGSINTLRTHQNGFCQEVCCIFMTGFPHDWEIYADGLLGQENVSGKNATPAFADVVFMKSFDFSASDVPSQNLDTVSAGRIFDCVASGCVDSIQECIDFVSKNFHTNDDTRVDSVACDSKGVNGIACGLEVGGQENLACVGDDIWKSGSMPELVAKTDLQSLTHLEEQAQIGETNGISSNKNSCLKRKRPYYTRQAKWGDVHIE